MLTGWMRRPSKSNGSAPRAGLPTRALTRPSERNEAANGPAAVSTTMSRVSTRPRSTATRTKQRRPFPHISVSLPSAFQ